MVELWDILDKNGNVTGRIHERGKPMNKGEYHLEVCVWIENDNGEYPVTEVGGLFQGVCLRLL